MSKSNRVNSTEIQHREFGLNTWVSLSCTIRGNLLPRITSYCGSKCHLLEGLRIQMSQADMNTNSYSKLPLPSTIQIFGRWKIIFVFIRQSFLLWPNFSENCPGEGLWDSAEWRRLQLHQGSKRNIWNLAQLDAGLEWLEFVKLREVSSQFSLSYVFFIAFIIDIIQDFVWCITYMHGKAAMERVKQREMANNPTNASTFIRNMFC